MCRHSVVAKCGKKVVWHWAHKSLDDCDSWSEGETVWHAAWKSRFLRTEVCISKGEEWHRADAVSACGSIIEFQHSSISCDEVALREAFYGRMLWIIDCTEAFHGRRLGLKFVNPEKGREFVKLRWKSRRRSFDNASRPVFLDLGFAFADYGESFYKPRPWWDDGDDGLRDGVMREGQLVWKRSTHDLFLLEVKKQNESGYGWGRMITHEDFCKRFGATGFVGYERAKSVREVPGGWVDRDSYTYRGQFGMGEFHRLSGYRWCEVQVERSRGITEET